MEVVHSNEHRTQEPPTVVSVQMNVDIEVLKAKLENVNSSVSQVSDKLDLLLSMQVQLVRLQEQHDNTRQSLDRAFDTLRKVRDTSDEAKSELQQRMSMLKGGLIVGAILASFVQWYVMQRLQDIEATARNVLAMERRVYAIETQLKEGLK